MVNKTKEGQSEFPEDAEAKRKQDAFLADYFKTYSNERILSMMQSADFNISTAHENAISGATLDGKNVESAGKVAVEESIRLKLLCKAELERRGMPKEEYEKDQIYDTEERQRIFLAQYFSKAGLERIGDLEAEIVIANMKIEKSPEDLLMGPDASLEIKDKLEIEKRRLLFVGTLGYKLMCEAAIENKKGGFGEQGIGVGDMVVE